MPSIWQAIDTNFPSFSGEETPRQQIQALHDYLFQLRQGLQYSLENLNTKKVNGTEFKKLSEEQKKQFKNLSDEQKATVLGVLTEVQTTMRSITTTVNGFSARITELEKLLGDVSDIEEWIGAVEPILHDHGERIEALEEAVSGEEGLRQKVDLLYSALDNILRVIKIADDGSVTIGTSDNKLDLVGSVCVNGAEWTETETET